MTPPIPVAERADWTPRMGALSPTMCSLRAKTTRRISHSVIIRHIPHAAPKRREIIISHAPILSSEGGGVGSTRFAEKLTSRPSSTSSSSSSSPSSSPPRVVEPRLEPRAVYRFSCVPTTTRSKSPPSAGHHRLICESRGSALPTFQVRVSTRMSAEDEGPAARPGFRRPAARGTSGGGGGG